MVSRKPLLSPDQNPPTQALALDARFHRKNGGVTIDGLEIAAVTEVIGGGGEMREFNFTQKVFETGDWSAVFKAKKTYLCFAVFCHFCPIVKKALRKNPPLCVTTFPYCCTIGRLKCCAICPVIIIIILLI